jgi:hypothetical protein
MAMNYTPLDSSFQCASFEYLSEEYRQVQQIRSINRVIKKAMAAALVQFHNVEFQKGSGPGIFPDLGVIVFHNKTSLKFPLMGSFVFHDKLACDAALKIIQEDGEDEDIKLIFPSKHSKEECVGILNHYLGLR